MWLNMFGNIGGGGLVTKLRLTLFDPWTGVDQAPLFMGFPRHWSGLPFPSPTEILQMIFEEMRDKN